MRIRRTGFTLVELLVVIAIIGSLMALITVAVQGGLEKARQTTCLNRMTELAKAANVFESQKGYFPGYRNSPLSTAPTAVKVSWQTLLLPFIDNKAVFDKWNASTYTIGDGRTPYLEMMVCPSDATASGSTEPVSSFVVNSGYMGDYPDPTGNTYANFVNSKYTGVCHDLSYPITKNQVKVSRTDISNGDGNDKTLLISENMDALWWSLEYENVTNSSLTQLKSGATEINPENFQAFFYYHKDLNPQTTTTPQHRINEYKGERIFPSPVSNITDASATQLPQRPISDDQYARASSAHPDIVNVVFAGSNARTILDSVDPQVWEMLMTTNGSKVYPKQVSPTYPVLNDGSY